MADLAKLVDELSGLTVLEAAELSKMLEEKWGVSAAAPVAMAAAGAPARSSSRGEDRVRCGPGECRRTEDQRHQGGARTDGPGSEGSEGPGGRCSQAGEDRSCQGRSRDHEEEADGSRRHRRGKIRIASKHHLSSPCPPESVRRAEDFLRLWILSAVRAYSMRFSAH